MSLIPMSLIIPRERLSHFEEASSVEWLEANGLGGWASSTLSGAHTRRYHGLLVSAETTSKRWLVLSRFEESLVIGKRSVALSANQFHDGAVSPQGFQYLDRFERSEAVHFDFRIEKFLLRRSILALHHQNATLIRYEIIEGPSACLLELKPFLAGRDIHALCRQNPEIDTFATFERGTLRCRTYLDVPDLLLRIDQGRFVAEPNWWNGFLYRAERDRGFDCLEDLFTPGILNLALFPGQAGFVLCSSAPSTVGVASRTEVDSRGSASRATRESRKGEKQSLESLWQAELLRRRGLMVSTPTGSDRAESLNASELLRLAADQFVVRRGDEGRSIIAGYPWFTDWGRDTMISLPGLCLCTGRTDDAKRILRVFRSYIRRGLLPNRFPDGESAPEYNSVDASLWAFEAIWQYYQQADDAGFVLSELLPMLDEIVGHFEVGTDFKIRVDSDGLLCAGDASMQLTWMDAKVAGVPVTPRYGKPVEINALWMNALCVLACLHERAGSVALARKFFERSQVVAASFRNQFWMRDANYFADCLIPQEPEGQWRLDTSFRPNQVLALSLSMPLPHSSQVNIAKAVARGTASDAVGLLISRDEACSVLTKIRDQLFVGIGLRTLTPSDSHYKPFYVGNPAERDGAYHQGTVWVWLVSHYLRAVARYGTEEELAQDGTLIMKSISSHLATGGVGSMSEILDAAQPHEPRGCPFQAWSVAAALECISLLGLAK